MAFNRAYLEKVHKECLDLGERKSNDYSSVADGIAICGLPGISTRLVDKVLRIKSLTTPGINQQVKDESIRDTLLDVINYATYGVALMDGQWGQESNSLRSWVTEASKDLANQVDISLKAKDLAKKNYDIKIDMPPQPALSKTLLNAQKEYNKLATNMALRHTIKIRKPHKQFKNVNEILYPIIMEKLIKRTSKWKPKSKKKK